jgi:hypothetical protein
MLGSNHDGEVVNAGRLAVRLIKEAGLTWPEILEYDMTGVAAQAAKQLLEENDRLRTDNAEMLGEIRQLRAQSLFVPDSWSEPQSVSERIEQAIAWTSILTDWEREFTTSIAGRRYLTEKQGARLDQISLKIERIARARGIAA